MSATSVLQSFSPTAMPGPVMPMDVAMRFYISHSPPPLRNFLSSYEDLQRARNRVHQTQKNPLRQGRLYKPLRPCLSGQQRTADTGAWPSGHKKRVVFADTKGMSLTAIHTFSHQDEEQWGTRCQAGLSEELMFDMSDLESATMDLKIPAVRSLAMDFKQPSADYLDFRSRLMKNCVCLESCTLQERSLTGTIKVRNLGFQKSVQVRISFDSWASYTDTECTFMNNVYGCQDTDTFAFALELPACVTPQNDVEFCVCFQAQHQVYWDNNDGKNYTLKHVGWDTPAAPPSASDHKKTADDRGAASRLLEMGFDQFGSPRMSSGLFPGWQSWGQVDTGVPYW